MHMSCWLKSTCKIFRPNKTSTTVGPLINDPLIKGQPLTLSISPTVYIHMKLIHFQFRKEDSLPTKDKMAGPEVSYTQWFHCILLELIS